MDDLKELDKKRQAAFQKAQKTKTVQACMDWSKLEDEYIIQLKLENSKAKVDNELL